MRSKNKSLKGNKGHQICQLKDTEEPMKPQTGLLPQVKSNNGGFLPNATASVGFASFQNAFKEMPASVLKSGAQMTVLVTPPPNVFAQYLNTV